MGCAIQLLGLVSLTCLGLFLTLWLAKPEPDDVRVVGVCVGLLLPVAVIVLWLMVSPRARAEQEALEVYTSFQDAARRDEYDQAREAMCPSSRGETSFRAFRASEARSLASSPSPTASRTSPDTVLISPGAWSGAEVSLARTDDGWCILELVGWVDDQ